MLRAKERQVSETVEGIQVGHVERYKFAARKAKDFILDAACGCGYGSSLLHKVGMVTGIDLEPEAIEYATKHYPGPDYRVSDVSRIECEDKSFDWVVSLETIEHLPDPEAALDEFRRLGENLIVSTPNEEHFRFKPENYAGDTFPHLRHYTPSEFEKLLNRSGWRVFEKYCQVWKTDKVTPGTEGMFLLYVCK